MGFFDFLKPKKTSTLNPEQEQMYQQMFQALQGGGGPLGDIYGFDPQQTTDLFQQSVANPAYQNFREQTVPGITGQFRGQNLQNSSYLGGALGKAGSDMQSGLDAQLSNMIYNAQQQAMSRKQQGVSDLMNTQTFAYQQSPWMSLLNQMAGGSGKALGGSTMGMADNIFQKLMPTIGNV